MFSYLASPYTSKADNPQTIKEEEQYRFEAAMKAINWLLDHRNTVYSPIMHYHQLAITHNLPKDIVFWRQRNLDMLEESKELLILTIGGWRESSGVQWEITQAIDLHLPIKLVVPVEAGETRGFHFEAFP